MTRSPIVSFGLCATSVAMKAKLGTMVLRDQFALARCALTYSAAIPACCAEVDVFLEAVQEAPNSAADRLISFAQGLVEPPLCDTPAYSWQARADLQ